MSHCCGEIPLEFVSFKATAFFSYGSGKEARNEKWWKFKKIYDFVVCTLTRLEGTWARWLLKLLFKSVLHARRGDTF